MGTIRQYSNTAVQTTLTADIGAGSTGMVVSSTSGYPAATPDKPFTVRINPGQPTEEIVDVIGGAGTASSPWILDVTNGTRAKDDTLSRAWSAGTAVVHGFSARDFRDIQVAADKAQNLVNNALPVRGIILWAGSTSEIPNGFRLCDGKSYLATGTGTQNNQVTDGTSNSVRTPNLTDRFVMGAGGTRSPDATGGFATPSSWTGNIVLLAANMPQVAHTHPATTTSSDSHSHSVSSSGAHVHLLKTRASSLVNGTGSYTGATTASTTSSDDFFATSGAHTHVTTADAHTHTLAAGSVSTGFASPTAVQTAPPWYALAYIMKVA